MKNRSTQQAKEKTAILYVDDEQKSLKYFKEIFADIAPIFVADHPATGLEIFRENHERIGLVLSDQKMPGESGIEFLEKVRELDPKPIRILVTAFSDLEIAVKALNDGLIYSYLTKPWDPEELEGRLKRALNHFELTRERDRLLQDKTLAFRQVMMAEKAATMGVIAAGLNHHMRNAITVIRAFFDMIPQQLVGELEGKKPSDSFFWDDYYKNVGTQISRLVSILGQLPEGMGGMEQEGMVLNIREGIDVTEVMAVAAAQNLEEGDEITFSVKKDPATPEISADLQKISRMAHFLIREAKTNIEGAGEIEIVVCPEDSVTGELDGVKIICYDSGKPIPEKDRLRLFDPFFVRSDRPSDLGTNLMTCYLIVFRHGGLIRAERLPDGKNAIEVILPMEPSPPEGHDVSMRLLEDVIRDVNIGVFDSSDEKGAFEIGLLS